MPNNINTTATQCTAGCVQCAKEESEVENPPVEMEAIEWLMASKGVMPAHQNAKKPNTVNATYTAKMYLATMCERGITFSERSEDSVWNKRIPPTRNNGNTATAMPIKPTLS